MIKIGILILALVSHLSETRSLKNDNVWGRWKSQHDKIYMTKEEEHERRQKWEKNVKMIQQHNLRYQLGLETYSLGLNHFADMDESEIIKCIGMSSSKRTMNETLSKATLYKVEQLSQVPANWDWVREGYVTPIRRQVGCTNMFCHTYKFSEGLRCMLCICCCWCHGSAIEKAHWKT